MRKYLALGAAAAAGAYIPALYDQKIYTPKMSQENGEVVGPDTIKKIACISANPEDHVKFIQQYIDLGFNYLIFHSAGPNHGPSLKGTVVMYCRDFARGLERLAECSNRRRWDDFLPGVF